ncbi:MAG: TonB-dependent receptor [Deltaproteobacteria bacterium]|nr:TonB-dependent receptor [Deltaproteobacteria bacterium]
MPGISFRTFLPLLAFTVLAAGAANLSAQTAQTSDPLDPVVVTGSPAGEERHRSPATVTVIDQEQIRTTNASSMTDLLSAAGALFLSEWTPGQTSINLRGGFSDGQGKDFKGQVMVLMNGRRAGTANLSKLSPGQVERIEIMRGPNSVMYGSQAIGGIINIILKNGRNTSGGLVDVRGGSSGLFQGHAEYGTPIGPSESVSLFFGADWGRKNDYHAGKDGGKEKNTGWTRKGGMADLDWRIDGTNTLHLNVRSDGIYDTGFRGSSANYFAKESRSNHSADLEWIYDPPGAAFEFVLHNYLVYDVDDFRWASPNSARTSKDFNTRKLSIAGAKFMPVWHVTSSNDLRFGIDFEKSTLRTGRLRVMIDGTPAGTPPQDMNQTESVLAFYIEDTARILDDRLTVRAGFRHTMGRLRLDDTPFTALENVTMRYRHTTWSAGLNFAVNDMLSLRAGAASGFRSPTASELGGWTSFLNSNTRTYGNSSVKPESNIMYEIGAYAYDTGWFGDLALFRNVVKNRIVADPMPGSPADSQYHNRDGSFITTGMELNGRVNVDELTDMGNFKLAFGLFATYNFVMKDEYNRDHINTDKIDRMYKYQASVFTQFGGTGSVPWLARITGILHGPLWHNTEEALLIPYYRPQRQHAIRKKSYWLVNLYGEAAVHDNISVYAGVNNVFNKNYHPVFIALDDGNTYLNPGSTNGGTGTSSPGAEFYVGARFTF